MDSVFGDLPMLKYTCNPKSILMAVLLSFMDIHMHRAAKNLSCPKTTYPAEVKQDNALPYFSSYIVNMCPFHNLFSATSSHFCVFVDFDV